MTTPPRPRSPSTPRLHAAAALAATMAATILPGGAPGQTPGEAAAENPFNLRPFHADFPVDLEYPRHQGLEFESTRRQILQQLASNLQGNVSREAWLMATEFYWRAPEDAVEPLIEEMDRAMGNPALGDVVRNCVEAMGKMGDERFDPALRRALQHKNPAVQQAAYASLGTAGTVETLRRLRADFGLMDGRSRSAWLRAVRLRLPEDRVEILRELMLAQVPSSVRDQVLEQALQLPTAEAAAVLEGRWDDAVDEFKAIIAGVLHANGDATGTVWLREALRGEDVQRMTHAIRRCAFGPDASAAIGDLREDVLRTTTHLRPEVRLAAAKLLTRVEGDDVVDVYEVLTAPTEIWDIRAIALRELTRRGRRQIVSVLLEELPTATGTRLQSIVNQLSASGDPRAVPVLVERFERAPAGEGRPFLQALAQNGSDAAAEALCRIFAAEERVVARSDGGDLTTRTYLPLLLLNLRGSERVVLDTFLALPRDAWRLRAHLLPTIAGYAADRRDQPELRDACLAPVRAILFDKEELPQLRVLALNLLTRNWLTVEDALRLKNMRHDEAPAMRVLIADFLHQYF